MYYKVISNLVACQISMFSCFAHFDYQGTNVSTVMATKRELVTIAFHVLNMTVSYPRGALYVTDFDRQISRAKFFNFS